MHLHSTETVLGLEKHPGLAGCATGTNGCTGVCPHPGHTAGAQMCHPPSPLGLSIPSCLGSLNQQFHISIGTSSVKPLGVTGKTLKSFKTQRSRGLQKTLPELASLKFCKSLIYFLRNRRCQNISWKPHTKSQTRMVLGEHLEAWFCSPKTPDWHSVKFSSSSSGIIPMILKYLLYGSL